MILLILYLKLYNFPNLLILLFIYFILVNNITNAADPVPNNCPRDQLYFGPCIGNQCPAECPVVCTCINGRDCCTSFRGGGGGNGSNNNNGDSSISSSALTRLLLALLLSSPPSHIGGPKARLSLVICRDLALNCALYTFYCALPVYALCMRANCAATCGLCNDGGGLLGMPLLLSLLGFDGLNGRNIGGNSVANNNNNNLPPPLPIPPSVPSDSSSLSNTAIRSGAPPIREENEENDENGNNRFNNISIQNSNIFPSIFNYKKEEQKLKNNQENIKQQPLQFAIPPGLQIPDHQKIKEKLIKIGALRRGY